MKKFSRTSKQSMSTVSLQPPQHFGQSDRPSSLTNRSHKCNSPEPGRRSHSLSDEPAYIILARACDQRKKRNLSAGFAKLKDNKRAMRQRDSKLRTLASILVRIQLSSAAIAISKMKRLVLARRLNRQGVCLTERCVKRIQVRLKRNVLQILFNHSKINLHSELQQLKEKGLKYDEMILPEQSMAELRKFQKTSAGKNVKTYRKLADEILKPILSQSGEFLVEKRLKKNIKSCTEVLINISQGQSQLIASMDDALDYKKEEAKKSLEEINSLKKEHGDYRIQINKQTKDLKKLDADLIQKNQGVANNPTIRSVYNPLIKILKAQSQECEKKAPDNYIYSSRKILLSMMLDHVSRSMEAIPAGSQHSSPASRKSPALQWTPQAITEMDSLQESGLIQQVIQELARIINIYGQNIEKSAQPQSTQKSDSMTEMMNIQKMVFQAEQILKIQQAEVEDLRKQINDKTAESEYKSKDNSFITENLEEKLNSLVQQIQQLKESHQLSVQKLEEELKNKQAEIERMRSAEEKSLDNGLLTNQLANTLQKFKTLETALREQVDQNRKMREELRELRLGKQSKEIIISKANQEYTRFKKAFKEHSRECKKREKSITQLISPKSSEQNSIVDLETSFFKSHRGKPNYRPMKSGSTETLQKNPPVARPSLNRTMIFDHRDLMIEELKRKIEDLNLEIASKKIQIEQLSCKNGFISASNVVTLLHNVMAKISGASEDSPIVKQMQEGLIRIVESKTEIQALMDLQVYSVLWVENNVVQKFEKKVNDKNKQLSDMLLSINQLHRELDQEEEKIVQPKRPIVRKSQRTGSSFRLTNPEECPGRAARAQ